MPVRIRLQRHGRKNRPFYHIVAADSRAPRDGKFIEKLGTYNPLTKPASIVLDNDRAYYWLTVGAQPSDTCRAILRYKGVLYRQHLMGGVAKGAMTEEEAMKRYEEHIAAKEGTHMDRTVKSKEERAAFHKAVSGTAPVIEEPVEEEETSAVEEADGIIETASAAASEVVDAAKELVEGVIDAAKEALTGDEDSSEEKTEA